MPRPKWSSSFGRVGIPECWWSCSVLTIAGTDGISMEPVADAGWGATLPALLGMGLAPVPWLIPTLVPHSSVGARGGRSPRAPGGGQPPVDSRRGRLGRRGGCWELLAHSVYLRSTMRAEGVRQETDLASAAAHLPGSLMVDLNVPWSGKSGPRKTHRWQEERQWHT